MIGTRACWYAGIFGLVCDQGSKFLVEQLLPFGSSFPVLSLGSVSLRCTFVTNTGAAWGLCSQMPWVLFVARCFFIGVLVRSFVRAQEPCVQWPLGAILTGACSNMVDSLFRGYVVDMIHVSFGRYEYPVFNGADMFIFCGALCLVSHLFFSPTSKGESSL